MAYEIVSSEVAENKDIGLGVELRFNFGPVFQTLYDTVEQATANLKNLILTRKGERLHQPTYGTDLLYAIFEPNATELKQLIQNMITDAVAYWLPYIEIDSVDVYTPVDDTSLTNTTKVTINYTVTPVDQTGTIQILAGEDGTLQVE